jgi:ferredoxin
VVTITIDDRKISIAPGSTILDAARQLGIEIPTLCFLQDYEPYTSCMVCVVHDIDSDQLLPSCSAQVVEGMRIETENEKVQTARKDTLDFLLSEHVGNCEAPCLRSCPAYMNIPLMIRQIKEQRFEEALITVKRNIALPAVLGRICPSPCERGCNRKYFDQTVSICLLKRFVADVDLSTNTPFKPHCKRESDKMIAIIGAGPAGLASAYYLVQEGHTCHIYDQQDQAGGLLRYAIPDERLDKTILDSEIQSIKALGVKFKMNKSLGKDFSLDELHKEYNAIILTIGTTELDCDFLPGINKTPRGIFVNKKTFETSRPGFFAGGNALAEGRMAIRSLSHGRFMATSVNQLLNNLPLTGFKRRFNSVMGHLSSEEGKEFAKQANRSHQINPHAGLAMGYYEAEAVQESTRCFRCDCRKQVTCILREYADKYGGSQLRFKTSIRKSFELINQHTEVIYEPGKCIKCGRCVKITERAGERFGLTFVNRGFDIRVEVPLNEDLQKGLEKVALQCVKACPTAALSLQDVHEEVEDVTL